MSQTGQTIATDQKAIDNLVSNLDVATAKDKAVFYSGRTSDGIINGNSAIGFIRGKEGYTIIDITQAEQMFTEKGLDLYKIDSKLADKYWGTLSKKYAKNVKGTVNAFIEKASKKRIFWQIEYPTLKNNPNVPGIKQYDSKTQKVINIEQFKR